MKLKSLELNYDRKRFLYFIYISIFFILICIDRLTKSLALNNQFSQFNGKYLSFELIINRGISWSLFHSEENKIFFLVSLIVFIIIIFLLVHIKAKIIREKIIIPEIFILSGAISNFVDRIFYSGVIDFILLSFKGWSFPIFNIADTCIAIGTLFLFIEVFQNNND